MAASLPLKNISDRKKIYTSNICNISHKNRVNNLHGDYEMTDNYEVTLEAGYIVRNVDSYKDAVRIAISEIGKKLNRKGLRFINIFPKLVNNEKSDILDYKESDIKAHIVAKTALIGIPLNLKVFNAKSREHAIKIAKNVVGNALPGISLEPIYTRISPPEELHREQYGL